MFLLFVLYSFAGRLDHLELGASELKYRFVCKEHFQKKIFSWKKVINYCRTDIYECNIPTDTRRTYSVHQELNESPKPPYFLLEERKVLSYMLLLIF